MKTMRGVEKVHLMAVACLVISSVACTSDDEQPPTGLADSLTAAAAMNPSLISEGRDIFRFDTFGNEWFWTGTLALHTKINALKPQDAIAAGLKIDADALDPVTRQQLAAGLVPLDNPAITVELIRQDAVLGVKGRVENGTLVEVGITCALCHSTVDGAVVPGVAGSRLDGWPNRDLNVGAIIAMSDLLEAPYNGWGPGMYDPRFNFNMDKPSEPVVLPPAFGLRHVRKELYTGDDVVSYWNAYVAITQMRGRGFFSDPRIGVTVDNTPPDLVSDKLAPLLAYQLSLNTPPARAGTYDAAAAARGKIVFNTTAGCARCHLGNIYSDINANKLWAADEVGQNGEYATRSVTKKYRTTPLRGLWNPPQLDGPYFHDGSAPTLAAVVDHYIGTFGLTLTTQQKADLVEFLKTL